MSATGNCTVKSRLVSHQLNYSHTRRNMAPKSVIWSFFEKINSESAKCLFCGEVLKGPQSSTTSYIFNFSLKFVHFKCTSLNLLFYFRKSWQRLHPLRGNVLSHQLTICHSQPCLNIKTNLLNWGHTVTLKLNLTHAR